MHKYQSAILAAVGGLCLFLTTSSFQLGSTQPSVALVDYGAVIWRVDRIRVYTESPRGMAIEDLTAAQTKKVLRSLREIETQVQALMEEHQFAIVLRLDSLPDREKDRVDFDVSKLFIPQNEYNTNEVNRLLNQRIVSHKSRDLTELVSKRILETRAADE